MRAHTYTLIAFATALAIGLAWAAPTLASTGDTRQKVVYHINGDDPRAQAIALRNIQNHINAVGSEQIEIQVVLHGRGVSLLLEPTEAAHTRLRRGNATESIESSISALKAQGVRFKVGANTLREKKINYRTDLYDVSQSDIVPSGIAELARLQGLGYIYIKP